MFFCYLVFGQLVFNVITKYNYFYFKHIYVS